MAVTSIITRARYTGNNSSVTPYAVPFRFAENSHVKVVVVSSTGVETALSLTTHYTLTGQDDPAGGSMTTVSAWNSTYQVIISRAMPATQPYTYSEGQRLPMSRLTKSFDWIAMTVQQIAASIVAGRRYLSFPISEPDASMTDLPVPAERVGKMIAFHATTGAMELQASNDFLGDDLAASAASAAAALASETAAAGSEAGVAASAAAALVSQSAAAGSAAAALVSQSAAAGSQSSSSGSAAAAAASADAASGSAAAAAAALGLKAPLDSPTFTGPVIFASTEDRPMSAGTGTPGVTDLITRADGDERFGAIALTSSLASDHVGVVSSTLLVDSGITLTLPAGTYELSGLLYVNGQSKASLILDSTTGVSCALVSHMGAVSGGSTLTYMAQGAILSFALGNSTSSALSFRLFGRIVLTETRTLKIQYAQNSSSGIQSTAKKESFLTAIPR